MKYAQLGRTDITLSRLGFGTGTSDSLGRCRHAIMEEKELVGLLQYAYSKGVNHWDTAIMYNTHGQLKIALREVGRDNIVLTTKVISTSGRDARRDLERSLRQLGTDHVDICLIHGVRNRRDFRGRTGALDELAKCKEAGKIRAIGLSSHGIGALEAALEAKEIEAVWARINYAAKLMDTRRLGLYDTLASMSWTKKLVKLLPKGTVAPMRTKPDVAPISEAIRQEVGRLLRMLHDSGKGVVGMKVFAEGRLGNDPRKALDFANHQPYLDAYIVGMLTKEEIDQNCRLTGGRVRPIR